MESPKELLICLKASGSFNCRTYNASCTRREKSACVSVPVLGGIFLLAASCLEARGPGGYEREDLGGSKVSRCHSYLGKS